MSSGDSLCDELLTRPRDSPSLTYSVAGHGSYLQNELRTLSTPQFRGRWLERKEFGVFRQDEWRCAGQGSGGGNALEQINGRETGMRSNQKDMMGVTRDKWGNERGFGLQSCLSPNDLQRRCDSFSCEFQGRRWHGQASACEGGNEASSESLSQRHWVGCLLCSCKF